MNPVITTINNIYVKIAWTQPNDNGAAITRYYILIVSNSGSGFSESPNCDGNNIMTFANMYCLVLMSELIDPNGIFRVNYNQLITAKVQAFNAAGNSPFSEINTTGATAENVPLPVSAPTRGELTTDT